MAFKRNQMLSIPLVLLVLCFRSKAYHSPALLSRIYEINQAGPYLGLVIPNKFEMNPLLHSPVFIADEDRPYIDISGRRFRIGTVMNHRVIAVMTGLGMINAAVTTQILLGFFSVHGVIHYGTAGNAYSGLHIGDVTIPRHWAHIGLWSWQKYGEGENDKLPLEENGDYTRDIGYLNFANYNVPVGKHVDNLLNNVWFQPDEIFPVNGTPEAREHVFWIPVSQSYYELAQKIESVKLDSCVNSTCLSHEPRIVRVERGCSVSVFLANAAYKNFLRDKFNVTSFDMESAGVAMICLSEGMPFIAMRGLVSDPTAEGSYDKNKSGIFTEVATKNSVTAISQFINLLPSPQGRRFHVGMIENEAVIVVMTGLGMINAAITTRLLLSFFSLRGVVHFGIAGNANSHYHIGDVVIPWQWAHTGLWSWQRYGDGENDELPLESQGDYTRDIGYLKFANYSTNCAEENVDNLLNNVWYQPEETFPENGTPEVREHAFWVNVSASYYQLAEQMENVALQSCVNSTTCLSTEPKIARVDRGCSACWNINSNCCVPSRVRVSMWTGPL